MVPTTPSPTILTLTSVHRKLPLAIPTPKAQAKTLAVLPARLQTHLLLRLRSHELHRNWSWNLYFTQLWCVYRTVHFHTFGKYNQSFKKHNWVEVHQSRGDIHNDICDLNHNHNRNIKNSGSNGFPICLLLSFWILN
ncbi:hypothetical protein PHYBLDRAFT_164887 [Phycomyces blakesleeanus NRRL 1555(-)]|uniref:Uncharacterized protein n=1 Tax=Phycomyces blakesleeanus (strain ATCC 8743b / DSM 1359 / FGSC 10004 / NBRC 33097 / NRRL 1555) TaxID=763407 RepID=A0A167PII6_PHYB8|nr:hypothetical protein PHYBLDRAFT_164887 [Phycomyces blakesleeanus NRRL 1555(-)]OAD78004.1 hypothetical protein PHYBLDRAFT_164887 [Phycomyces blakesleeanus NRRL 1555(-)]|eukprot:XP_018296044.1 hypothetical protein PHYBLDRAFT_164887 [Phycomyces blakesleeanus NRRL 1555(-)]